MIRLTLIRHGVTDWNVQRRYQGHSDLALNLTGQVQAAQVARRLAATRIHAVISSDSARALETAARIAEPHGLVVQAEAGLREAHFGSFEGLRYPDVIAQQPAAAEAWFADPEQPPPGGERLSQVAARVAAARDRLLAAYPNKRLVIVGHGGSLRLLLCGLIGLPAVEYWRFNLDPGSLSQIDVHPGGAILVRLNDVSHLEAEAET